MQVICGLASATCSSFPPIPEELGGIVETELRPETALILSSAVRQNLIDTLTVALSANEAVTSVQDNIEVIDDGTTVTVQLNNPDGSSSALMALDLPADATLESVAASVQNNLANFGLDGLVAFDEDTFAFVESSDISLPIGSEPIPGFSSTDSDSGLVESLIKAVSEIGEREPANSRSLTRQIE